MSENKDELSAKSTTVNKVAGYKFLQSEIARYLGNDGFLAEEENQQLQMLCKILDISSEDYGRLKKMAESELSNFRIDAVLGFALGRVSSSKLYSDAEKISVRGSLADRWVDKLKELATPKRKNDSTDDARLECGCRIAAWLGFSEKDFSDWFKKHYSKKLGKAVEKEDAISQMDSDEKSREEDTFKDIDNLLMKQGFIEKKNHIDATKHPIALCIYVVILILVTCGLYRSQFYELNIIHPETSEYVMVTDLRDGNQYKTVTIGHIQWFAENLNYKTDNSVSSGLKAEGGQLYTWNEAVGACPEGWRLPTDNEWRGLFDLAGGTSLAGRNLKSLSMWEDGLLSTDSLNFSALPAGKRSVVRRSLTYSDEGKAAYWWVYTMLNDKEADYVQMNAESDTAEIGATKTGNALSVRCVKLDGVLVPVRKGPKASDSIFSQTLKGEVDGFKDLTYVPVIKTSPNKRESLYSYEVYANLAGVNTNFNVAMNPAFSAKLIEMGKKPLFLQGASVVVKRSYERTYARKNDTWVRDSIWRNDSVSVSGQFSFLNMEALTENSCGVTVKANLGVDTTATLVLSKPCSFYSVGNVYQVESHFTMQVNRSCRGIDCSSELENVTYSVTKTDAYKLNDEKD